MGTVHKFKRPPKNQKQFRGYRSQGPGGPGRGKPPRGPGLWARLKPWQRSLAAWALLIALAILARLLF
jgi:hypothetical protein